MTPPDVDPEHPAAQRTRGALLVAWIVPHPVAAVFLGALLARLMFVAATIAATDAVLIPDEYQYLYINTRMADGTFFPGLWSGYAKSLYDATAALNRPMTLIFEVFWPWRGFGMLFSAVLGAITAAVAAALARGLDGRTRVTFVAGGIVALVPSQILWSSAMLREAEIWAVIGLMACLVWRFVEESTTPRVRALTCVGLAALLAVGCYTRVQTAIIAGWCIPIAALLAAPRMRLRLVAAGLAVAVLVPFACSLGPGGYELVQAAVPSLGRTRTYLSLNAESSFVERTEAEGELVPGPQRPVSGAGSPGDQETPGAGPTAIVNRPAPTIPGDGSKRVISNSDGVSYAVEESFDANVKSIPKGLVATLLRPFPWERTTGIALLFARVENLLWYMLYVVAGVGLWQHRRRREILAFPVMLTGGILLVAALTQGNLGTAFRHRGQVLWALAPVAAVGLLRVLELVGALRRGEPGRTADRSVRAT